jgi:hypothetical protein
MLGLEPVEDRLTVDPALPGGLGYLQLMDIRGRWGRLDAFGRETAQVAKRRVELGDRYSGGAGLQAKTIAGKAKGSARVPKRERTSSRTSLPRRKGGFARHSG